jgi:hypothetical protein
MTGLLGFGENRLGAMDDDQTPEYNPRPETETPTGFKPGIQPHAGTKISSDYD